MDKRNNNAPLEETTMRLDRRKVLKGLARTAVSAAAIRAHDFGARGVQVRLVAGGDLEDGGFDLNEALLGEKAP